MLNYSGGLLLGGGHDPRGTCGGFSSSFTNAQGETTAEMANQLRALLSRVNSMLSYLQSLIYLFVDQSNLGFGLLGRELMTWRPGS